MWGRVQGAGDDSGCKICSDGLLRPLKCQMCYEKVCSKCYAELDVCPFCWQDLGELDIIRVRHGKTVARKESLFQNMKAEPERLS